ncbi:MAG: class I SAM-dependent methyltransferase [Helicobacteraceae bacterium]|nr:class I SAM-dependent methyltransferase [Helicobacteraceae bacterium]
MIEKYGKAFSNAKINRTPKWIDDAIKRCKNEAEKFAKKERKNLTQCPMCESGDRVEYVEVYGFHYVECQNCGNLYLRDPILNTSELYTNDGSESPNDSVYLSDEAFFSRLENIIKPKISFINEVARAENISGTWLDLGSGGGDCLYAARELGYKIKGYESDLKAVSFANCKLGGDVVKEGFLDIDNCEEGLREAIYGADIISFFNVLEHLDNPKDTIEFFAKNMKKDALLVIEVPQHNCLSSLANLCANDRIYRHYVAPIHLNIFTKKSLELAYENGGG